jgi:hypothetical protein
MSTASPATLERSFAAVMNEYCGYLRETLIDTQAFDLIQKHADHFPLSLSKFWCLEIPLCDEKKKLTSYFASRIPINVLNIF